MRYGRRSALLSRPRRPVASIASANEVGRKHRPDYVLVVLIGALLSIGAVVVYAIGPGLTIGTELDQDFYSTKQLIAIGLGVMAFLFAAYTPLNRWQRFQPFIVASAAFIAIAVRFLGEEVNGAHRWIQAGGFSFQAAELIKLAIVLWLAAFLSQKRIDKSMGSTDTLRSLGLLVGAVIIIVAGLQSDLGSAAVMMAIIATVAFVAGLPFKKLGMVTVIVLAVSVLAVVSSPYRRDRVQTFLNPTADCQDAGYQACQALITVGSGGLIGKGVGRSVQAYGYLPEPANDSIFAITAEKFGFVGAAALVGLFTALFSRIARIAQSAPTEYARLLVMGVLVWLSVQMIINVAAMIGLLPLKGITLPFVSYGGTSIIFVMTAMGIVFHVSGYTDLTAAAANRSSRRANMQNNKYQRKLR
jgi:cell division protein FtsW